MITYEYSEFFPEDENQFSKEEVLRMLSEMVMRQSVSVEEALRYILNNGIKVNIFLREWGMESFIKGLQDKIDDIIAAILATYNIQPVLESLDKETNEKLEELKNKHKDQPEIAARFQAFILNRNSDVLRRLKWEFKNPLLTKDIDKIMVDVQDRDKLELVNKMFTFTGKEVPTRKKAMEIASELLRFHGLGETLKHTIETGDLYNRDLDFVADMIGQEAYEEFKELREKIFENLKKILKENGDIVQTESGEFQLSPKSIRKIGFVALQEIFSDMQADSSSGSHTTKETGDSENITSSTRPFEFGDNISHIDFPGSIVNSIVKKGNSRPSLQDLDVHLARGSAKSATVILLDMSGSMARADRFYNAKKMALAMDSLIQNDYKDDKLVIIGFGTTAKILKVPDLPSLQPFPITIYNPYIKLRFDFSRMNKEQIESRVPMYFTNLQKGLSLARQILSSKQIKNKDIFLITDGAPTAHFKGSVLHVNYPPTPPDFDEALNEVKLCREDGVTINTFLMTNEWDYNYFGEQSFIQQFAKISRGRIFYPHPHELDKMVVYDFIANKKKKFKL